MSNYQEKRKKVMDKLVPSLALNRCESFSIDLDEVNFVLDQLKGRRPFTSIHIENKKYESFFESKKAYDKFMTTCMNIKDFKFKQDLVYTEKYKIFLQRVKFEDSIKILNKISERELSAHNIISNIPRNLKYPELWADFMLKILSYSISFETLLKLISLSNYRRILEAPNKDKLLNELAFIETHKSLSVSNDSAQNPYMLLTGFDRGDFMSYTKNSGIITGIGSETLCCFRKGGVGEPLMMISLKSPIAGILYGSKIDRTKWFAYVWEIVEYNSTTNNFDINLVLDNIEANKRLNRDDYDIILSNLTLYNKYNKVYLGYLRNDIIIPNSIEETRRLKPYNIPFYGREISKYSIYDDSKYIYTMIDRQNESDFERNKINLGDFHRIQYILDQETYNTLDTDELKQRLVVNKESILAKTKFTKKFKIEDNIDLEKSFIESNDYSIKSFELYDNEGIIFAKFN